MTKGFSNQPDRDGLRFLTIAELSARDFFKARRFSGFSQWATFDDFELERECLALGYASAGVCAPRQVVGFAAFEGWARLTGAPVDLDGLDEFAAHWRYRARRPNAPVRGVCGAPGEPERHAVAVAGAQIVVVRERVFVKWRDEVSAGAPFPASNLNAYATQVVACCLTASARTRRSALKSV